MRILLAVVLSFFAFVPSLASAQSPYGKYVELRVGNDYSESVLVKPQIGNCAYVNHNYPVHPHSHATMPVLLETSENPLCKKRDETSIRFWVETLLFHQSVGQIWMHSRDQVNWDVSATNGTKVCMRVRGRDVTVEPCK